METFSGSARAQGKLECSSWPLVLLILAAGYTGGGVTADQPRRW